MWILFYFLINLCPDDSFWFSDYFLLSDALFEEGIKQNTDPFLLIDHFNFNKENNIITF